MRKIKEVHVINPYGDRHYEIGQIVNGLTLATIKHYSNEALTEITGWDAEGQIVVNVINCPVVVEYYEVQEAAK